MLQNFVRNIEMDNLKTVTGNILDLTWVALSALFEDKSMYQPKNFKMYFYDDYIKHLNVSNGNCLNLFVEIDQPNNIKPKDLKSKKSKKYDVAVERYFDLKEIKNGIFNILVNQMFGPNAVLWQDNYSIHVSSTETDGNKDVNYHFKITPAFTVKLEGKKEKGILYYSNKRDFIKVDYPKLFIKNLDKKNKDTQGLYKQYILIFKNMFMIQTKETSVANDIFEILLYNVPNTFFVDLSKQTFFNIINFMRNKSIKDYITCDEQDKAFIGGFKTMSYLYASNAIKQVEKFIKKNL